MSNLAQIQGVNDFGSGQTNIWHTGHVTLIAGTLLLLELCQQRQTTELQG